MDNTRGTEMNQTSVPKSLTGSIENSQQVPITTTISVMFQKYMWVGIFRRESMVGIQTMKP